MQTDIPIEQYTKANGRCQELTIQIPEGVAFSLPLAGPMSRFLAWLIDAVGILAVGKVLQVAVTLLGVISSDLSQAMSIIAYFLLNIGYAAALEWYWNGQTIGKRLVGLRVMDIRGLHLQPSQVIIRNLLRAVDSLPVLYLVGGMTCLINRHAQRVGDIAANTVVVKATKVRLPQIDQILEAKQYNSLRKYPHLVARLRQQVNPKEADIALQALMRRDDLAPPSRVALFETIAQHFRRKVKFPDTVLAGISDEQYVHNVVDVMYRR